MLCCFFVFAVNGLYGMILGSMLPLISDEYGLSNTVSGTLLSAHSLGNLTAGFLAGILPVYLGRKKAKKSNHLSVQFRRGGLCHHDNDRKSSPVDIGLPVYRHQPGKYLQFQQ